MLIITITKKITNNYNNKYKLKILIKNFKKKNILKIIIFV